MSTSIGKKKMFLSFQFSVCIRISFLVLVYFAKGKGSRLVNVHSAMKRDFSHYVGNRSRSTQYEQSCGVVCRLVETKISVQCFDLGA